MTALKASALMALGLCGCGPKMVQGSLSAVMSLNYTGVQALTDGSQASVKFTTPQGAGINIVLEVAAQVSDLVLTPNAIINLAELGPNGFQRGVVSRDVVNDPFHTFPALTLGTLQFNALITPGATVSGNFNVTFVEGDTPVSGHTAYANFTAEVPKQ
jgi:hypothetical protein